MSHRRATSQKHVHAIVDLVDLDALGQEEGELRLVRVRGDRGEVLEHRLDADWPEHRAIDVLDEKLGHIVERDDSELRQREVLRIVDEVRPLDPEDLDEAGVVLHRQEEPMLALDAVLARLLEAGFAILRQCRPPAAPRSS